MTLNQHIKKIWVVSNKSKSRSKKLNQMLPDGCLEIVFVQGQGFKLATLDDTFFCTEGIYLGGQLTEPINFEILPETTLFFIKIYPWTSSLLTSLPLSEVTNKVVLFSDINNSLTKKFQLPQPLNIYEAAQILNREMEIRAGLCKDSETLFRSCHRLTNYTTEFSQSKKKLLIDLKISSRTLEKKFNQFIGLSPKQYSQTVRFRNILEHLNYGKGDSSLVSISTEYGFFDQAHFIRSFKSVMGVPPTKLDMENYFIPNSNEQFRYYTI